jgi:hypothetical protein
MTLYRFIALDHNKQAEAIWSATFLFIRSNNDYLIMLYKINDFYVEVFYHPKNNKIERIRPFTTKKLLEPYYNL